MHEPTDQRNFPKLARRTGLAYLGIIVTGVLAEFLVRGSLVVEGDPVTTATNIAESPWLFGAGIGADVLMVALDVTVAIGLYRLLRGVDRRLAMAATVLRLIQAAVLATNLLNLVHALRLAGDATAEATILPGPAGEVLDAVQRHALGYDVGLIAFGLSCIVLGRLLSSSGLVSRPLAVGMSATGVVYLAGSFAAVFAADASGLIEPFYLIPFVGEIAFAVRLVRGLRTTEPNTVRPATPAAA